MISGNSSLPSELVSNVIENVACRIAQRNAGRISPNHVLPYLPVSLGIVTSCLDQMVDNTSVVSATKDNLVEYEFSAYRDSPVESGILTVGSCVSCDKDQPRPGGEILCPSCTMLLRKDLTALAEKAGWPAQAVYEHEILYHAAGEPRPVHAESLAGSSRYTLRNMHRKLDRLTLDHFARQELDQDTGIMTYHFPQIEYPRSLYSKNMAVIRSYPASVMEEVQVKIVRILISLGLMFLGLLILAFCGIPFPLLVLFAIVAAPVTAFLIWRHRDRPEEE